MLRHSSNSTFHAYGHFEVSGRSNGNKLRNTSEKKPVLLDIRPKVSRLHVAEDRESSACINCPHCAKTSARTLQTNTSKRPTSQNSRKETISIYWLAWDQPVCLFFSLFLTWLLHEGCKQSAWLSLVGHWPASSCLQGFVSKLFGQRTRGSQTFRGFESF